MIKIALLLESNSVWLFKSIEETINILEKEGYKILGIIETEAILSKHRGLDIPLWYLKTFGFYDFFKLGTFSFVRSFRQIFYYKKCILSFRKLSKELEIQYLKCKTPNKLEIINWIKFNQIDIVISQTSFILKSEILMAPNLGVINKHAALLPSNKGLFPYFWAFKNNSPQGISYHLMDEKIDEGKLLIQEVYPKSFNSGSMINFYRYVFYNFPYYVKLAVNACINKNYKKPLNNIENTYFSLPTKKDMKVFRKKGGRIIDWGDIIKEFFNLI